MSSTGPAAETRPAVVVYSNSEVIGDGLIKLPALAALRGAFPEHHLTWMAGRGPTVYAGVLKPLVEGLVDEVIGNAGVGDHLREVFGRPLGGRGFDIIIDTQQIVKTSLILRRMPHRLFVSWAAKGLLSDRRPPAKPAAMLDRIMALISLASGRPVAPVRDLRIPKACREAARALLPEGRVYVGIAPGAGGQNKRWPLERFTALAQRQAAAGRTPVFFIGPGELGLVGELRAAVPGALFPELAVPSDISSGPILSIALAERLHVGVANDAGAGHILAAGGRPLVSLFGPTNAEKFVSLGSARTVIRAQDFGGEEMERIPLDAVASTVDRLLAVTG